MNASASFPVRSRSQRERTSKTTNLEPAQLLGAHMSISGGVEKAIGRAISIGCTAIQVFVKNNMQWFAQPLAPSEIEAFHTHPDRPALHFVFGHSGYLINLAATNPEFHEKSLRSLAEELMRADQLRLPFLVLHPGAHMGAGVEPGLKKVVASIDAVHRALPKIRTKIALETTAGQGTCLGHTFEELAFIVNHCEAPQRLLVCADTAHLFAAGYDVSTAAGVKKTFAKLEREIGPERLAAIHLNDSKTALGSRVDRHEAIGQGRIGLECFRYLMCEERFAKVPKVLETPKGKDMAEDVINLGVLRSLQPAGKRSKARRKTEL